MAYASNAPFGLKVFNSYTASTFNGQTTPYDIASGYASSIFKGDPVYQDGNGNIILATAGAPMFGVFDGNFYTDANGEGKNRNYWPGGTTTLSNQPGEAWINTDPNLQYMIQVSTSANPTAAAAITLTSAMIGANANFNVGGSWGPPADSPYQNNPATGNTVSGQSAYYLDLSTVATGGASAALSLKIMGIAPIPNNYYDTPFNIALVRINNNVLQGGTGTAGV